MGADIRNIEALGGDKSVSRNTDKLHKQMNIITEILESTKHRSYAYPQSNWIYYQEWNRVLFLHYEVPFNLLRKLVPEELNIDTFNGKAYISIVPFTMERIRPRLLPSIEFISNFGEINVRTYVEKEDKKGVYFINIEAEKYLSALIAKGLSGLPYERSNIKIQGTKYQSKNTSKGFYLNTEYRTGAKISQKSELDIWLTEKYCLYHKNKNSLYRYEIHHKEWELNEVEILYLDLNYKMKDLTINHKTELAHYSKGVQVIAWNKEKIK